MERPKVYRVIATFFGAGYAPVAPGTFGSLAALPLACIAAWNLWIGLLLAAFLIVIGIPASTSVAREVGKEDPGIVVIDEAAGMTIATLGLGLTVYNVAAAFLAFRLFDIVKPPPCRQLERLPGGYGIVLDDVAAGIYALLTLKFLHIFI